MEDEPPKFCLNPDPSLPNTIVLDAQGESRYFTFDHVAGPLTSQAEIFAMVGKPCVVQALAGYNGCVFAYGQTGAGKTHTMLGSTEQPGILPKSLEFLFEQVHSDIQQNASVEYLIKCSFLEIYNEHIIDLLNPQTGNLQLREDLKKGVYVEYLSEEVFPSFNNQIYQICNNITQAINVIHKGNTNRHIGSTTMNIESSRSHSVFTLQVESQRLSSATMVKNHRFARMHFVDLAGSERQKSSNAQGERLREGCNINKSLHILGNVINSLAELSSQTVQQRFVHYRDSKLTFLLKDSLGGNSRTHLIANVHQAASQYYESLSTLQFAKRVKQVRNKAQVNEDDTGNLDSLKNEIKRLKQELAKKTVESEFVWETPRKERASILKSQNFLSSLEAEAFILGDEKYQRLEELLRCYLEQSIEAETLLHIQVEKAEDIITEIKKLIQQGKDRELHLRTIIAIQNAKLHNKGLNEPGLAALVQQVSISPVVWRVIQENLEMKEGGGLQLQESAHLLQENLTVLHNIQETLRDSMSERRSLQDQVHEKINQKFVSPAKYTELEIQIDTQERQHIIKTEELVHQIKELKVQKYQLEQSIADSEFLSERLNTEHIILKQEVTRIQAIAEERATTAEGQTTQLEQELNSQKECLAAELERLRVDWDKLHERTQIQAREQASIIEEKNEQYEQLKLLLSERELVVYRVQTSLDEAKLERTEIEQQIKNEQEIHDNIQIETSVKVLLIQDQLDQALALVQIKEEVVEELQQQVLVTKLQNQEVFDTYEQTALYEKTLQTEQLSELDQQLKIAQANVFQEKQKAEVEKIEFQEQINKVQISHITEKMENQQIIFDLRQQIDQLQSSSDALKGNKSKLDEVLIQTKDSLNTEIQDLRAQVSTDRKRIRQLQLEMEQKQEIQSKLVKNWQGECATLEAKLELVTNQGEERVVKLENQLLIEQDQLKTVEKKALIDIKLKQQRIIQIEQEMNNNNQVSQNKITGYDTRITQLNEQLQASEQKVKQISEQVMLQVEQHKSIQNTSMSLSQGLEVKMAQMKLDNIKCNQENTIQNNMLRSKVEELEISKKVQLKQVKELEQKLSIETSDLSKSNSNLIIELNQEKEKNVAIKRDFEVQIISDNKQSRMQTDTLNKQKEDLSSELKACENTLSIYQNKYRDFEIIHQKTVEQLKQNQVEISMKDETLRVVIKKKEEIVKNLEELNKGIILKDRDIQIKDKEIQIKDKEIQNKDKEIQNKDKEISDQKQQLKEILSLAEAGEHHLNETKSKFNSRIMIQKQQSDDTHKRQYQDFEDEKRKMKQQYTNLIDNLSAQNAQLVQENRDKEAANNELINKLSSLQKELQRKHEQLSQEFAQMKQQNLILSSQIDDQKHGNGRIFEEKRGLQIQAQEKQRVIDQLKVELSENEMTLKTVHDKAKDFCRQQEREINEIKEQYLKLEEEHNAIIDQNQLLQGENDQLITDLQNINQERDVLREDIKQARQFDIKLKKENQEYHDRISRNQVDKNLMQKEIENLQNEIDQLMGNNNPAQKENTVLKQDKHHLNEQISILIENKNILMSKLKSLSPTRARREEMDYDRVIQENVKLQNDISKLNNILNIPSNKKHAAQSHEVDRIIQSVQLLIQDLVECKSQNQLKDRELEQKNIKHQSVERDLLLLRQKYYSTQRENSSNQQQVTSGDSILKERGKINGKSVNNYQFQGQ